MQERHFPKNERVLLLTVIHTAIEDARNTKPKLREPAVKWLFEDEADIRTICELAQVDPAHVRRTLASRLSSLPSPSVPLPPPSTPFGA